MSIADNSEKLPDISGKYITNILLFKFTNYKFTKKNYNFSVVYFFYRYDFNTRTTLKQSQLFFIQMKISKIYNIF
jgi:hypothetical protein